MGNKIAKHGECDHGLNAPKTKRGLCRYCERIYMREYRKRYRTRKNAKERERYRKRKIEAVKYLGGKCLDCNIADIRVLVFDHTSDNKSANVAHLMTKKWERLKEEPDKCDLVCANCHLIRTNERISEQNEADTFQGKRGRNAT